MATLDDLKRKRAVVKGNLTRFKHFFDQIDKNNPDLLQLELRLQKLETYWQSFDEIQTNIELLDKGNDLVHETERKAFEDDYFDYEARAKRMLIACPSNQKGLEEAVTPGNNIKLPIINLPSFDGTYSNWLYFKDTFISIIHSNSTISDIQKFHYLRSSLRGEAADVISALEVSASNYKTAWDLIIERYENTVLLINTHVKALFNLPAVSKESHLSLRSLLDNFTKHLRALEALGQETNKWDTLILFMITSKVDHVTRREWESRNANKNKLPSVTELTNFLKEKCSLLETLGTSGALEQKPKSKNFVINEKCPLCNICKGNHYINQCERFLKLTPDKRYAEIKSRNICSNCLKGGHTNKTCTSSCCKKCHKRHHTLLHFDTIESKASTLENNPQNGLNVADDSSNNVVFAHSSVNSNQILLSTALIQVIDAFGRYHECRALLDSGSQSHFITRELTERLKIKQIKTNISVTGINQSCNRISYSTNVEIKSNVNSFSTKITCLIVSKITDNLPSFSFSKNLMELPSGIKLADPTFNECNKIDLLIGADLFWSLLKLGQIKLGNDKPILQNTLFGWVISGKISYAQINSFAVQCNFISNNELDNSLKKFWEIEDLGLNVHLSSEERDAEEFFQKTTTRQSDGRFVVRLPLKSPPSLLGETKQIAMRRLYSIEKKINKNSDLKQQYTQFMKEYHSLGHMSKIDSNLDDNSFYIPHHFVKKENSITSKLRVVFDASCKSSSGLSVNDIQIVGPTIQQDLFSIVLRYRSYKYVLAGDVVKMYRQVLIHPDDRKLQKIFWRENINQPIECFELKTVTYGYASASFLAIRCLHELAYIHSLSHPEASKIILEDFYVDDLLTGSNNIHSLLKLFKEISSILKSGCFILNKWISNSSLILENIQNSESNAIFNIGNNDETYALGLLWHSKSDLLNYNLKNIDLEQRPTKRTILSIIARIYDPLGLVSPVIITAKIILQKLWQLKLSWDESLPLDLSYEWQEYASTLHHLNNIFVPRSVVCDQPVSIEIHGFADASKYAYGSCIYIRSVDAQGKCSIELLCAKSRVAPLKILTIPKLELCAALLLAQLYDKLRRSWGFKYNIDKLFFWIDSTIVLSWINAEPSTWKVFVANRVSEIQSSTNKSDWHYVNTRDNPGDIVSRGLGPSMLRNSDLWWHGPSWLKNSLADLPRKPDPLISNDPDMEFNNQKIISAPVQYNELNIFDKYSTITKLQRVVGYMLRFRNSTLKKSEKIIGPLTVNELDHSLNTLVRIVQSESFSHEINNLLKGMPLSKGSKLKNLNPFLDQFGILRVGGRLGQSQLDFNKRFPIVLPNYHKFSNLLVTFHHRKLLHAGPQLLLASLREHFWIISGRRLVRKIVHDCIICFRANPIENVQYLMADLPKERLVPNHPFNICGIDYCGPFNLRDRKLRSFKITKAYICTFVCFVTKACHLELVSELSSEAFLACLYRFISRRGKCSDIYSDNATNFVGASSDLQKFLISVEGEVQSKMGLEGIQWHFLPPRSPHFGGIWEANVKSIKHHLKRVVGETNLTFEEFNTVIVQVEACLNSRPLYPMSNDPNDLSPLTPGHFLIGRPLTSVPSQDFSLIKDSCLSRYQRCQKITRDIWSRWSKEYISELQTRSKWKESCSQLLKPGVLVVIKEDNLPPLKWKTGRILQVHPGSDGVVRVVTLKTSSGVYKRPAVKLCILPIDKPLETLNLGSKLSTGAVC